MTKPRIALSKHRRDLWVCAGEDCSACGNSPKSAYVNWRVKRNNKGIGEFAFSDWGPGRRFMKPKGKQIPIK